MEKYASQKKYQADHRKDIKLAFILPSEQDIYDRLCAEKNKNGYIKGLIRADLEKSKR